MNYKNFLFIGFLFSLFFVININSCFAKNFSEQRKYIGQEYDSATQLDYLNARYYDAKRGQFISADPLVRTNPEQLLTDPQQLNDYSYARNNPINASDPSGELTIIIPGTKYDPKAWSESGVMSSFVSSVNKTFNETHQTSIINDRTVWSGEDTPKARGKAANYITDLIKNYNFANGEKLNIVGYSHGGNIGIQVSQTTDHKIDNLVTLGTPVRSDYQPNHNMIGNFINVYSHLDPVQALLGGRGGYSDNWNSYGLVNKIINHFLEFGLAERKYGGAENINATRQALNPFTAHGAYFSQSIWSLVDKMINK
jgi:RHS repeat-associated protein